MPVDRDRVYKIKFGDSTRRIKLHLKNYNDNSEDWRRVIKPFKDLKERVEELFDLHGKQFLINYTDADNDVISIADDDDMEQLFEQSMNPVRMQVTLVKSGSKSSGVGPDSRPLQVTQITSQQAAGIPVEDLMKILSSNLESVKKQMQSYQALYAKGTVKSAAQVPGLLENLLHMISVATEVVTSGVKSGLT